MRRSRSAGYIAMNLPGPMDGRDAFTLRLIGTHDVAEGHGGYVLSPSLRYTAPVGARLRINATGFTTYASDAYVDSYFSITPAGAAASGLRAFDADDGFKDYGLTLSATYDLFEHWGVTAALRYTTPA